MLAVLYSNVISPMNLYSYRNDTSFPTRPRGLAVQYCKPNRQQRSSDVQYRNLDQEQNRTSGNKPPSLFRNSRYRSSGIEFRIGQKQKYSNAFLIQEQERSIGTDLGIGSTVPPSRFRSRTEAQALIWEQAEQYRHPDLGIGQKHRH